MSAESHRKQSREKSVGKVILPQVVEDKSLIDSFTGFIQDVVPQVMKQIFCILQRTGSRLFGPFPKIDFLVLFLRPVRIRGFQEFSFSSSFLFPPLPFA